MSMDINRFNNANELIGIANCSIISMKPSSGYDSIILNKNVMFVVLALCVATCLMSACVLQQVCIYFRIPTTNEVKGVQRASVISYDVEDNGDLPGIELYQARKHTSFTSQPVSEFSQFTQSVPKVHLIAVDSACTNVTTDFGPIPEVEPQFRELQFSQEYYEYTNDAI
eukprot:UN10664